MRVLAVLLSPAIAAGLLLTAAADPPSCAPFSDPGCFFGETFEGGTLKGWAPHGSVAVVAPGLNGTKHKAKLSNSGLSSGAGMDSSIKKPIPDGTVYYMEFWLEYAPDFAWQFNASAGNSSFKTLDIVGPSACPAGTGGNRILLTVWGSEDDQPPYSRGRPQISIYPNYCKGGTDAGGSNKDTEKFANVAESFAFVGGHAPYRVVIEVTSRTGPNGRVRMWVDDALISDRAGVQTSTDATFLPNAIGVGGPQANSGAGQWFAISRIRFTTTSLVPGAARPPAP